MPRLNTIEQHQAAAVLQPEVEHDQRRLAHLDRPQPLPRAGRPDRVEAIGDRVLDQERARNAIVLDGQDTTGLSRRAIEI